MKNILEQDLNTNKQTFAGVSTYDFRANIEYRKFFMNLITKNEAMAVDTQNWDGENSFFTEETNSRKPSEFKNNLANRTGMSKRSFKQTGMSFSKRGSIRTNQ